jgi:acyl-CoA dehydrogenase
MSAVPPPYFGAEHQAFRETVRRFVGEEIAPHAAAWDEAETFPRELYRKAAAGLLGLGFAEEIMKDLAARQLGF